MRELTWTWATSLKSFLTDCANRRSKLTSENLKTGSGTWAMILTRFKPGSFRSPSQHATVSIMQVTWELNTIVMGYKSKWISINFLSVPESCCYFFILFEVMKWSDLHISGRETVTPFYNQIWLWEGIGAVLKQSLVISKPYWSWNGPEQDYSLVMASMPKWF